MDAEDAPEPGGTKFLTVRQAAQQLMFDETLVISGGEFGGAGVLVFDIDARHKFVKRIGTTASKLAKPRNIKGVVASAATKKLHFTTPESLFCVDLVSERTDWSKDLRVRSARGHTRWEDAVRSVV